MNSKTSLASQLRRLETPQTNILHEARSRPSFLYDRKEAVSIDKDTHFIIGSTGFRSICSIDPFLAEFEYLFSVVNKDLDRAVKSKKENENLNQLIKKFLYQVVSPYFLLSHTHKMLEWLIYRYSIHEYNFDDLIVAVLPYHETKFFPRIVQLSSKIRDASSKWHWLIDVYKNSVPLPKVSLINHFKSNSSTISSLMDLILKTVVDQHKLPVVVSFFTSTLVTILEDDFITENSFRDKFVPIILNYLLKGSKSKDRSLVQSCYIVLSQLATRSTIEGEKLNKLLSKMAEYLIASGDKENEKNFLLTLLIVYEFQGLKRMSKEIANSVNLDDFIQISNQIHSKYFFTSLLKCCISHCEDDEDYMKCIKLIDNLKLSLWTISKVLKAIVKKAQNPSIQSKLSNIVQTLERRFPNEFDGATNKNNIKGLGDLIVSPFYTKLNDKNINVFVGLTSSNEGIRLHSACHIAKNHKEILKCTDEDMKHCIADALTNTSLETNPLVLIELLSCRDLFIKMVPLYDIVEYGKKLLPRCVEMIRQFKKDEEMTNDWIIVRRNCFKLVSNFAFKDESQFWDLFVDYFLPLDETGLSLFSVIFETDIEKTVISWTKSIYTEELKKFIGMKDYGSSINLVTLRIAQHLQKNPNSPLLDILNKPGQENYNKQVLGLCIIFHLLPMQVQNYELTNKLGLTALSILNKLSDPSDSKFKRTAYEDADYYDNIKDFINSSVKYLTKRYVTSSMIQLFISQIITSHKQPQNKPWFWHHQTIENNYIYGLFNFLCFQSQHGKTQLISVYRNLFKFFLKQMQSTSPKFLIGLWTKTDDPLLQSRALQVSSLSLKKDDFTNIELISFCIALQSPHTSVRSCAIKILEIETKAGSLISFLSSYKELIHGDPRMISIALAKYFTDHSSDQSKTSFTFKSLSVYLKQDPNIPSSLLVELTTMLRDYNTVECLKLFITLLDFETCNPYKRQMTYHAGRKIIEILPVVDDFENTIYIQTPIRSCLKKLFASDEYRPMLINLFDDSYVKQLSNKSKQLIIECLLNVIQIESDNFSREEFVIISNEFPKIFRKFLTDGGLVARIIEKIIDSDDGSENEEEGGRGQTKRRRLEKKMIFEYNSNKCKKIMILLEMLKPKKSFTQPEQLMEMIFKLLKENLLSEEQSSSEHFRSLLLTILSNCLNESEIDLSNFELVYILEALRHARLKKHRMQALTIINRISSHMKEDILRDIIVIFGFIGNDMVKYDDQYTLTVLDDTMETLIPGLIKSSEDSQKKIIETFTDAFNDIPLHRRLYLFQKLTSLLGEEKCLWYIVYKLIRRSHEIEESKKRIQEFASALVYGFDGIIQMNTINQLMSMCLEILDKGSFEALGETHRFIESIRSDLVRDVVITICLIVSSEDYVAAIAKSKWSDMENLFNDLFETNLLLIDMSFKVENKANRIANRLTRDLFRVLEKVNTLLPGPEFVSVIHRLLKSKALIVRHKALDLLNARLTTNTLEKSEVSMLCINKFIKPIVNIVNEITENETDLQIVTSQTGLISIKILSKLLQGDDDSVQLLNGALESLIELYKHKSKNTNENLLASIILCISQLISCLKNDCLSLIPDVVLITLETLNETSEVLLLSCLTSLGKITKIFGKYLSSNLVQLLKSICSLDRKANFSGMANRVDKVIGNIAAEVPFRILVKSLEQAYDQLDETKSLYTCLSVLNRALINCDKTEIEPNRPNLQKFALKMLDYRSLNCDSVDGQSINKVEDKSLEAITNFVLKLSKSSFREFFNKVYDWVSAGDGRNYSRILTFYRLTDKLANKLKHLFSAVAAPCIVNICVKQLKFFNVNNEDGILRSSSNKKTSKSNKELGHFIVLNILTTLSKSFQYDNASAFATSVCTKKLYPLVLDQIANDFGSNEEYYERIDKGVIPCVQHLVRAVNDHNIVRDLNSQLLLKTRENSAKIRHQVLHVLHQLILSMTEEYTPYIPEAIPFLAELHEDDSDTIQKLLVTVFSDIEKIFGEPISSYF